MPRRRAGWSPARRSRLLEPTPDIDPRRRTGRRGRLRRRCALRDRPGADAGGRRLRRGRLHAGAVGALRAPEPELLCAASAEGAPTKEDIEHLLLDDNAIVVSYPANATKATQDELAKWASAQVAAVVIPDRAADAPPLRARIATAELRCDGIDTTQLTAFAGKRGTGSVAPHPDEG